MKKILLAHRGYSEIAPENTSLAFDLAYMFGFDGVEIDLHMTKDKKLVVIHDEKLNRTSNGVGLIKNKTLKELLTYDYGNKFKTPVPFQKLLTYEEFLQKYENKFKVINVEIKTDIYHYKGIEKLIWKVDKKIKHQAKIIYSSFNFKSIEIIRKFSEDIEIGFLFVEKSDLKKNENKILNVCNYLHPWFKSLTKKTEINYYKKFKLPLNVWTIDIRNNDDTWTKNSFKAIKDLNKIKDVYSLISNSKF